MLSVVMIGYGAIAQYVAQALEEADGVKLRYVLCRSGREEVATAALAGHPKAVTDFADIASDISLAIECGGHPALIQHGPDILESGIDIISVSAGALADDDVAKILSESAREGSSQLRLVAGAVGGRDALNAARQGGLAKVTYVGRKKPLGWKGSLAEEVIDLETVTKPVCHFKGTARDAALKYPKNANVAATIALSGIGFDETDVELYADPTVSANMHEVVATGAFGELRFEVGGLTLPDNPKSSALTAMSVVHAVTQRIVPVSV
ncbi:MAG: aspartate dehydrogenase [Sneathiella sp.]